MSTQARSSAMLIPGLTGLTVFLALHVFFSLTWKSLFAWASVNQAWWLDSGASVAVTLVVTFLATVSVLATTKVPLLSGSAAMMAGLAIGMTLVLFFIGPGNMWPVVLVLGSALLSVPVVLGASLAWGLRRRS